MLASSLGLLDPSIIKLSNLTLTLATHTHIYICIYCPKLIPQELAGGSTALTSKGQILAYCATGVLEWSEQWVGMLWAQPSPLEAEGATWEAVWKAAVAP